MLASRLSSTLLRNSTITTRQALRTTTPTLRLFHSTPSIMADFPEGHKDQSAPPPHQLVYFKGLTKNVREFGVFRKVLHTSMYSQLVAMEIPVGGDIGDEVHTVDQVLIFTSGEGEADVAGRKQKVSANDVVVVPAGTQHQFWNTGKTPLELVTVYSPAEHQADTVHKTKEEGDELEDAGKDEAPEWSQQSKDANEKKGLVKEEGGPYKGE